MTSKKVIGRIEPAGRGRLTTSARGHMAFEFSGRDVADAMAAQARSEYPVWTLTKRTHTCTATVRATPGGPELRIAIDGELWWSHVYQGATDEWLTGEADRKRDEFMAKGWAP